MSDKHFNIWSYVGDSPNFTKVPSDGIYRHVPLIFNHMAFVAGSMKLTHSVLNKCHFNHQQGTDPEVNPQPYIHTLNPLWSECRQKH
jgi:hypothetical protein